MLFLRTQNGTVSDRAYDEWRREEARAREKLALAAECRAKGRKEGLEVAKTLAETVLAEHPNSSEGLIQFLAALTAKLEE